MSFSVGFPNAGSITIGGKSTATLKALSESAEQASALVPADEKERDSNQVRTGGGAPAQAKEESGSTQSIAVKVLLKRMQELQQQLREQQQQLAAAQAAAYPTEEAKATVVMSIQGQIVETNGALAQVTASLIKELTKDGASGGLVSTTV
ncbi:hypothetical protein [Pseudomonas sp. PB3P13]